MLAKALPPTTRFVPAGTLSRTVSRAVWMATVSTVLRVSKTSMVAAPAAPMSQASASLPMSVHVELAVWRKVTAPPAGRSRTQPAAVPSMFCQVPTLPASMRKATDPRFGVVAGTTVSQ